MSEVSEVGESGRKIDARRRRLDHDRRYFLVHSPIAPSDTRPTVARRHDAFGRLTVAHNGGRVMGCLFSKSEDDKQRAVRSKYAVQSSAPNSPSKPTGGVVNAPASTKPKLDPKDFIFLKRHGETLVKAPGTINGQQFVIDSCEDCEIYVLDHCDSLMIDDCKRCKIVVGPTSGSIFIRDCEDCRCVLMCRQYRSRDCVNIDTHLHVTTRPIIETSTNMRFGCWDFSYPGLEAQMDAAGISPYQNFWSHIFNFNPRTPPRGASSPRTLPPSPPSNPSRTSLTSWESPTRSPTARASTPSAARGANATRRADPARGCLVLVPSADARMAAEIIAMASAAKTTLVRTNHTKVSEAWARGFLEEGAWTAACTPRRCRRAGASGSSSGRGVRGRHARGGVQRRVRHAHRSESLRRVAIHGGGGVRRGTRRTRVASESG